MMKEKNAAADLGIAGAAPARRPRLDGAAADFLETARYASVALMERDGGKAACM
jgi:hypothetical protein